MSKNSAAGQVETRVLREEQIMSDPLALLFFAIVFIPLLLIHFQNARKERQQIIDLLQKTNILLSEIVEKREKDKQ